MPRPVVTGTGLPGPGQEVWGEGLKKTIRDMVFKEDYVTVLRQEDEDEGGSQSQEWTPVHVYDGRIDNVRSSGGEAKDFGEQLSERVASILSLPPGVDVKTSDRFEVEGSVWICNSKFVRTDEATTRLQVEELHG